MAREKAKEEASSTTQDKRPIRVLAVTNTYPTERTPGDTPCIRDQVESLRKERVAVELFHIDRSQGKRKAYLLAAIKLFLLNFTSRRYDLIHAYYGHCGLLSRLQFKYPIVVTFLGSDLLGRKDGWIGRRVVRVVDSVIVMSEQMRRAAAKRGTVVIPFGANLDLFRPGEDREKSRAELGFGPEERIVLFPWRPKRPEKRFDVIEKAVGILKSEGWPVRLISLYGQPQETVARYMRSCDAIALASDHEGSPLAVREAMGCDLPIVSVDVGDVRRVISGVENCYLCERDPQDMADKLWKVLEHRLRSNGSRIIREREEGQAAKEIVQIYERILGKE